MKKEKVSCIIPAHNEAERVERVLSTIFDHPLLDEIIVVQNFSTDNTSQVVRNFIKKHNARKVKLLEENKYSGKAYAMYLGVEKSKNPIMLFLDADLKGLSKKNVSDLILPIIKNEADLTMSFRGSTPTINKLFKVDPFTGERAVKKDLFLKMPDCKYSKFGIEILQNKFMISSKKRIRIVKMLNVHNVMKYKKMGFFKGWHYDIRMTMEILKAVSVFEFVKIMIFISRNAERD